MSVTGESMGYLVLVNRLPRNSVVRLTDRPDMIIAVYYGREKGGESRGFNDRVYGISCRYSDKTCKKINYISANIYSIIMQ